jgi:hypothetical protein
VTLHAAATAAPDEGLERIPSSDYSRRKNYGYDFFPVTYRCTEKPLIPLYEPEMLQSLLKRNLKYL